MTPTREGSSSLQSVLHISGNVPEEHVALLLREVDLDDFDLARGKLDERLAIQL